MFLISELVASAALSSFVVLQLVRRARQEASKSYGDLSAIVIIAA